MPYGVTTDGFVIKPLATIRSEIDSYQKTNVDAGLTLIDKSSLGQLNLSVSNQCAELWEMGQAVYSNSWADSANGFSLDGVCEYTGTERDQNSKTIGTAQVTLNPDKNLPAGSLAHPTGRPNDLFESLTEVPADPAGGTFDVQFRAQTAGAIPVTAGQLSEIAQPVPGWTAVTNSAAFTTGDAREEDDELRAKRVNELQAGGSTNVDAIRAGLLTLTGVIDARVYENDKGIVQNGLKPHSIRCILRGGTSSEIGQKIFDKKGAGAPDTNGLQNETIEDTMGKTHEVYFDWGTQKTFYATMVIEKGDNWDATNDPPAIKAALAAYVNSLGIGEDVIYQECEDAVRSINTSYGDKVYKITSLFIDFAPGPSGTSDLPVTDEEYALADVANISVS